MRSMTRFLRPADYVAAIRMERQKHKGAFLLLEGSSDSRRFRKFFEDSISVINCHGKQNVLDVIELLQDIGTEDCLGFVDADFDRLTGTALENEDVIVSRTHDFDLDVCSSGVIDRYMDEVADAAKVQAVGGLRQCVANLLEALKPLSAVRFANQKHGLGYSLSDVRLSDFFDGATTDIDRLIDAVSQRRLASQEHRQALRAHIDGYSGAAFDVWQFTNGHDFVEGLGIALRSHLGGRPIPQTWRNEIEKHLRLAIDMDDFTGLGYVAEIKAWESSRGGKWSVLRANR